MTHNLTLLGTSSGCGTPMFFCDCPACEEARHNPKARRGCCGFVVRSDERTLLVDTPPDLRHQLIREGITDIDALFYTHAHYDHLGGLGELEYLVRLAHKGEPLKMRGSEACLATITHEYHYMTDCFDMEPFVPYETVEYDGISYTPMPVTHAPGTYGYLIQSDKTSIFYASDTGRLPGETARRISGVDHFIMDATFWARNWYPQSHHSIQETIEEGFELDAGTIYLTHLAMHYDTPITLAELEEYLTQYEGRVKVAYDGMQIPL